MDFAIVTVNYRNAAATSRLVRSLASQNDRRVEIIIVDNDSGEQERSELGALTASVQIPVRLHLLDVNRGFAAGCNAGLRLAFRQGADWVALINNDAVTGPGAIASLCGMLSDAPPAIVAVPLLEREIPVRCGLVRWLSPTLPHASAALHPSDRPYAVGGGMAIHRDVFARLGPLDERYFLYFEDADYSERARRAGFPILLADIPALSHEVSATTSRLGAPLLLRYHMRNALLFNALHGPWWVRISLHLWAFFVIVKQAIKALLAPERRPHARAIALGIADFYASRFGRIPTNDPPHRY